MKHTSHKGLMLISFQWTRVANLLHAECDLRGKREGSHYYCILLQWKYYSSKRPPLMSGLVAYGRWLREVSLIAI